VILSLLPNSLRFRWARLSGRAIQFLPSDGVGNNPLGRKTGYPEKMIESRAMISNE
jgi:hypothetical protein